MREFVGTQLTKLSCCCLRRANIGEFLEDADAKRLFIFFDPKGELLASNNAPGTYKKNQKVRVVAASRRAYPCFVLAQTRSRAPGAPNVARVRRRCTL